MMYGKPKTTPKAPPKKGVPVTIMVAVGKPKLPVKGQRAATNMMRQHAVHGRVAGLPWVRLDALFRISPFSLIFVAKNGLLIPCHLPQVLPYRA